MVGRDARKDAYDESDDYVRIPTPDSSLVRTDGSTASLLGLATDRAVLRVLLLPPSEARAATLTRTFEWSSRLSRVAVLPVLPEAQRPILPSGVPDDGLFDPERRLAEFFATAERPAAVLLGVDGLLAGGPVFGIAAIDGFVDDIAEALTDPGFAGAVAALPIPVSAKCITYGGSS